MSPASISSSFLQEAVRREGGSSPIVPPPPLPLDTRSEEERRDTNVEGNMKYLVGLSIHVRSGVGEGNGKALMEGKEWQMKG